MLTLNEPEMLNTKEPSNPTFFIKKFGGTSVGSIERLEHITNLISKEYKSGKIPIVVLSAMSGETNRLVKMASEIDPYQRGDAYDMLLASGEQVSIALFSMALKKKGIPAIPLLAFQLGIETDSLYSKARIKKIDIKKLKNFLNQKIVPVVAGFQGIDKKERITTLGRGGSDITAVAISAALGSSACEIYTDVSAVYSADPRLVKQAKKLQSITYEEMMEMSALGSKVLNARAVELGAKYKVQIHVRSSFEDVKGTWIVSEEESMEEPLVSSVVHESNTMVVKIYPLPDQEDFLAYLFESLSKKGVVVDIITEGYGHHKELSLSFSIGLEDEFQVRETLKDLLKDCNSSLSFMKHVAKISVVGVGMKNHPGVAALFFRTLNKHKIPVHLVTTSEIKISAIIDKKNLKLAAESLHNQFGLDTLYK